MVLPNDSDSGRYSRGLDRISNTVRGDNGYHGASLSNIALAANAMAAIDCWKFSSRAGSAARPALPGGTTETNPWDTIPAELSEECLWRHSRHDQTHHHRGWDVHYVHHQRVD